MIRQLCVVLIGLAGFSLTAGVNAADRIDLACERLRATHPEVNESALVSVALTPCLNLSIEIREHALRLLDEHPSQFSEDDPDWEALEAAAMDAAPEDDLLGAILSMSIEEQQEARAGLLLHLDLLKAKQALRLGPAADALRALQDLKLKLANSSRYGADVDQGLASFDPSSLIAILRGQSSPANRLINDAVPQPWIRVIPRWRCGTGDVMALMYESTVPNSAEAWLARGEPEIALRQHLSEHWPFELGNSLGLPNQLRQFAGRGFGVEQAQADFDAALASIQIQPGAFGPSAQMFWFGSWWPLPVAEQRMDEPSRSGEETPKSVPVWYREEDLRNALRLAWSNQDPDRLIEAAMEELEP